jgi:hypothetical protein
VLWLNFASAWYPEVASVLPPDGKYDDDEVLPREDWWHFHVMKLPGLGMTWENFLVMCLCMSQLCNFLGGQSHP